MFGVCIRHNNIGRDKLSLICCIGPIIIPLAADQSPLHKKSHHKVVIVFMLYSVGTGFILIITLLIMTKRNCQHVVCLESLTCY